MKRIVLKLTVAAIVLAAVFGVRAQSTNVGIKIFQLPQATTNIPNTAHIIINLSTNTDDTHHIYLTNFATALIPLVTGVIELEGSTGYLELE